MNHVERRHFFVREMAVEKMRIRVPFVSTVDNLADFFEHEAVAREIVLPHA